MISEGNHHKEVLELSCNMITQLMISDYYIMERVVGITYGDEPNV